MFITVEGIDGSGKTEFVRWLAAQLAFLERPTYFTYEPGGTQIGQSIGQLVLTPSTADTIAYQKTVSDITQASAVSFHAGESLTPLTELFLFSAARAQHVELLRAELARGAIIVCDRFVDSTRAYQGAHDLPAATIEEVIRLSTGGLEPDVTFLLDLPVQDAATRLHQRGRQNRFDLLESVFMNRVRMRYLELASTYRARFVTLDARRPLDELIPVAWAQICARLLLLPATHIEQGEHSMRPGSTRRTSAQDKIVKEFHSRLEQGITPMPGDIAEATGVSVSTVRVVLRNRNLWTAERKQAARTESFRRATVSREQKIAEGKATRAGAAEGYPQLVAARKARAERRATEAAANAQSDEHVATMPAKRDKRDKRGDRDSAGKGHKSDKLLRAESAFRQPALLGS